MVTDEQACADWLAKLPATPPIDNPEETARYRLSEDAALAPGTLTINDGMVSADLWGFIVRAHPAVARAARVRWPDLDDNARAYALTTMVDDAT